MKNLSGSLTISTLTEYQIACLSHWTRTQLVEFLMNEGLRGPRRALRGRSTEWLMQECVIEGVLQCGQCGNETNRDNPLLDTGYCEKCQEKAEEGREEEQ